MTRSDKQTLITGCYRTGTEYITLLLNNHPELSSTMYTVSFMRFCYDKYNPVDEESNYTRLLLDSQDRIRERWNRTLNTDEIIKYCKSVDTVDYGLLYDLMMSNLFLTDKKMRWAEKTQLVWTKIPAFLEMFSDGNVIHIQRDPRSVLASFKNYTYAPPPAYLGAIFNCYGSMKLGLEYKKKYKRYKSVRYEDVMLSPEDTLIDIFDFLGLSHDHDLLSEEGWVDAHGDPWGHNSAFMKSHQKKQNFNKESSIKRWKKNLEEWEIALCEAICGDVMVDYDYELSDVKLDWRKYLKPIFSDDALNEFFRRWIVKGEGIEQFPTDPLKRENWTENVITEIA